MMKKVYIIMVMVMVMFVLNPMQAYAIDNQIDNFLNLCKNGTVDQFDRIIKKIGVNAPLDQNLNTPIMIAAENGMKGIVRRLINMGANANYTNKNKQNAIMACIHRCNFDPKVTLEMIDMLVKAGCNINQIDNNGYHSIHYLFEFTCATLFWPKVYPSMMYLKDKHNFDIMRKDKHGHAFYHLVVKYLKTTKEILDIFLDMKIPIYDADPEGFSVYSGIKYYASLEERNPMLVNSLTSHRGLLKYLNKRLGKEQLNPYD